MLLTNGLQKGLGGVVASSSQQQLGPQSQLARPSYHQFSTSRVSPVCVQASSVAGTSVCLCLSVHNCVVSRRVATDMLFITKMASKQSGLKRRNSTGTTCYFSLRRGDCCSRKGDGKVHSKIAFKDRALHPSAKQQPREPSSIGQGWRGVFVDGFGSADA